MFNAVGVPVRVEAVALSDRRGTTKMRILTADPGRSTIETANPLDDEDRSPCAEITVRVRRLDDYQFDSVGFMKIDVEGHELAVLNGAVVTIERNRPALLIELEERHRKNAVADTASLLKSLRYDGYFLLEGRVCSIGEFDRDLHQNPANISSWKEGWKRRGTYANSFVFLPIELMGAAIRMELIIGTSVGKFGRIIASQP
jgi:FkbM family methyltransferase